MSLSLSSSELEKLTRAIHLLMSPLDHESVDAWRSAVNRQLRELLHADSAGFLLPVSDGLMLYSEEHDPRELARYPDYPPPPMVDGTPLWQKMIEEEVVTLAVAYGRKYDRYLNSTYYQEYAGANGAHDTLAVAVPLGGADARSMASLHFWHARPNGRLFGEREVAIMRLLFPSFRAGVESQVRWADRRADLLDALDHLGQAILVCDASGRPAHQTPALTAMLAADPESARLRSELLATVNVLRRTVLIPSSGGIGAPMSSPSAEVRTELARYRVRATLFGGAPAGSNPMILVALERCTPVPLSDAELKQRFELTGAEIRVARLIALARSNADIATELSISPHTARRHTERVLMKLGVRSRAAVGPKISG